MIDINDLLAYLVVLDVKPVLNQLTFNQLKTGHQHVMGCLVRLIDQIEDESYLKIAIKNREYLNGIHPVGHPELQTATEEVAVLLQAYLVGSQRDEK
jgi:hypothetical protein